MVDTIYGFSTFRGSKRFQQIHEFSEGNEPLFAYRVVQGFSFDHSGLTCSFTYGKVAYGQEIVNLRGQSNIELVASKDTYAYADFLNRSLVFAYVNNGDPAPSVDEHWIPLRKIVTNGAGVTSSTDLRSNSGLGTGVVHAGNFATDAYDGTTIGVDGNGALTLIGGGGGIDGTLVAAEVLFALDTDTAETKSTFTFTKATDTLNITKINLGAGAVGTPSIFFNSDTDSGFWSPGSNNIALSLNGAKVADFLTTNITLTPAARSGVSTNLLTFTAPSESSAALTASTNIPDIYLNLTREVQFATGAKTLQYAIQIGQVTWRSVGATTITNGATIGIRRPTAGTSVSLTNSWHLYTEDTIFAVGMAGTSESSVLIGTAAAASTISTGCTVVGPNSFAASANSVSIGRSNNVSGGSHVSVGVANTLSAIGSSLAYGLNLSSTFRWTAQFGIGSGTSLNTTAELQTIIGVSIPVNDVMCNDFFLNGVTFSGTTTNQTVRLQSVGAFGTNKAGSILAIAGGKATGNATSGNVIIQTSTPGASGTTLQTLSTRATFSSTELALTYPIWLTDGTKTNPPYSFSNDTNTGIYRIGADNIGISCGDTKIFDIATTGATITGTLSISGKFSSTVAAGNPVFDFTETSDTPVTTWTSGATASNPVGFCEVLTNNGTRYIPLYA